MSEELQRGLKQTPPASQPPSGHGESTTTHIVGQEGILQYCQPNIHPQDHHHHHHPSASPLFLGRDFRAHGPLPSAPPPPPQASVNIHSHSVAPPHYHGHPPPMFSRPPPPMPPRFSQPHMPNIPYQAVLQDSSVEGSVWHQHDPPPVPQHLHGLGPALNTTLTNKATAYIGQEEKDVHWLKEFEKKVKSSLPPPPPCPGSTTTTHSRMDVKLAEVQRLVQESHLLTEQLQGLEEEMSQVSDTADESEWERLVKEAEEVKFKLDEILKKFRDEKFVERTKTLLKQRRAKRNRHKQRKKEMKLEKEQMRREREEKEMEIDVWRAKLQREEEAKRQEEAVKREADAILGEVRQKQSEAQRMLQLVEALAVLRQARATQAAAQGQPKDAKAEERFTATTGLIAEAVKKQLKEYELEEQTLRVMMEESTSHRSAALSVKEDAVLGRFKDSVKKLLFGSAATHEDAELPLEVLIQRRQEWDQFVVEGDSPLASAVPLSWVLPPAQSDSRWAAFLKR